MHCTMSISSHIAFIYAEREEEREWCG
jgi:hypothetical protein